jgi:hypothetical protein
LVEIITSPCKKIRQIIIFVDIMNEMMEYQYEIDAKKGRKNEIRATSSIEKGSSHVGIVGKKRYVCKG